MASVVRGETKQIGDVDQRGAFKADSLAVGLIFFAALSVLQRCVGFGRSLLFCHLMSDEELGRWSMAFSFLMMAAPLAVFGLPGSFGRYFEHYRQRGQTHGFLRRVISATFVLTVLFVGSVLLAPGVYSRLLLGTPDESALIQNLGIALALVIAMNVVIELATAMRQVRLVSMIQFLQSMLFAVMACVLLITTPLADQGVVIAYSMAALVSVLIAIWVLLRRVRTVQADTQPLGRSLWSRLLPFAAWMWVSNALFNLFDTVDRLMIVHLTDGGMSADALVGQYHASRVVPTLLVALAGMLAGVILPYLSEDWERGARTRVSTTTTLSIKVCCLTFVAGGAVVLMTAPFLFGTLLQGKYDAGMQVLPCTMVYCVWFAMTILAENHLLCAERARSVSLVLLIGLSINIALNAVLLPRFGLAGAVAATAVANVFALGVVLKIAAMGGLTLDRWMVLIVALPAVLLFGWLVAIVTVLLIVTLAMRDGVIFNGAERLAIRHSLEKLNRGRFA